MSVSPTALWQIFDDHSRSLSLRDAVVYGETRLTYEELLDRSRAVAASWLDRAKADRGMRILILLNDPLEILVSILAAWSLDSTAAVLRPYGAERVPRLYLDTILPDLIVTADSVRAPESDRISQFLRSPEECLILGTSGTTAEPKFAAIPVSCIDLTTSTIADDLGINARDRVQVAAPLTYFYGLTGERSWLFGRGRPSFSMLRHSFRVLSRRLFGVTRSPSCRERHRSIGWGSSFGTARRSRACE
jgi:acyl-coenzyme A synthetase/AMP-(fatty) acid ligase